MGKTTASNSSQSGFDNNGFEDATLVNAKNFDSTKKDIPFFARAVLKLLLKVESGEIHIRFPNGKAVHFTSGNPGYSAKIHLKNWSVTRKVVLHGTIGVAESYMDHDWESPDVSSLLAFFLTNASIYQDIANQNPLINALESLRHWFNRNTRSGAKRNIAAHYDLGNEFYELWLDKSMTYSSAIFRPGVNSLESAQEAKYRNLAETMGVTKDSHILEIGSGWGGFAEFVGRETGARVTGLTISREQLEYARNRIKKAGLADRIEFKFQDYRDEAGKYDQIVSIEMFEAVGERYWATYFDKLRQCLKPNGTAGLQIITINDNGFEQYRRRPDFIQRYIFPGGMLPSPSALSEVSKAQQLKLVSELEFAGDYAKTLREWRKKFQQHWEQIHPLGFDERFKRMWEFYLHYCEAGFDTKAIDVRQMFYKHA